MLIITGFEPFGKFEINPAWEVAKLIGRGEKFKIPVSFRDAKKYAERIIKGKPDTVIAIGLSPSSRKIKIEALGINLMHSNTPDNYGYAPQNEKIFEDGKNCYFSNIPFFELAEFLKKDYDIKVSFSAGTYVCNSFLYSLLYFQDRFSKRTNVVFIHIPPSREITKDGWELERIKGAIEKIIDFTSRLSSP